MIPLVDGDILVYELGFAAETGWRSLHPDSTDPPPWDYVQELLDNRISEICVKAGATAAPEIYLTGKNNFRDAIAKKKPYKGNRDNLKKPWHYKNIQVYLKGIYGATTVEGMEADDAICIRQSASMGTTIICTRDKDLRQCPGWHFGWELGKQPQFGPKLVDVIGEIKLVKDEIKGWGLKFFYAQVITGDTTDNIPGLPGKGATYAFNLLDPLDNEADLELAVAIAYETKYGEDKWREEMREQAQLLWMVRHLDVNGKPIMWDFMYA